MPMPIIPSLAGPAEPSTGATGPLTDFLDSLSPEEIGELTALAEQWVNDGEPIPPTLDLPAEDEGLDEGAANEETDPDDPDAGVEDDSGVDEHVESLEDEAAESPEEQSQEAEAGVEDFGALLQQVEAVQTDAAKIREDLDATLEAAKEAEDVGGDPDEVEDAIEDADKLIEEIAELYKDAEDAADDEDADGIAQAGLFAKEKLELLKQLAKTAKVHATANQPDPKAVDPGTGEPVEKPALKLWAEKYSV